jgi:HK97 family phage major capsid protein
MPTAIPTSAAELEEFLGDSEKITAMLANRPQDFKQVVTNYARTVMARDEGIETQIKDEVQKTLRDFIKANGTQATKRLKLDNGLPVQSGTDKGHFYNNTAPGAKVDKEVYSDGVTMAQFMRDTWHKSTDSTSVGIQQKLTQVKNTFGSTVPSDGGFLIPEVLRSQLLSIALESAIVRPRAMVVPMDSLRVPFPTIDTTTDSGSVYGGVVTYWTPESGALTVSSAKFGRVVLEALKLTAYTEVPNELFADSIISMQAFIDQKFPEAIAFAEDYTFINGSGVGVPRGYLKGGSVISVTKQAGQAVDTVVWQNIVKMFSRMLPSSLGKAVWVASIDTFPELATMALAVGTGGSAVWLNNGAAGPPMTILGRPVIFTEKTPKLGDAGDISFVDLSYYLVGDRQAIQAETSPHFKFQNDQTAVRIVERVDGRPWVESAITPANGSTATLSPFVQIEAR